MKRDFSEYVFAVVVLVFGMAAEELLPRIGPVGLPVLLMAAAVFAVGSRTASAFLFALGAGAAEEAISGFPPMTAMGFFLSVAVFARRSRAPRWAMAFAYPAFQTWLWVWTVGAGGSVFLRLLAAVPAGFAAVYAVSFLMERLGRAVALGEEA